MFFILARVFIRVTRVILKVNGDFSLLETNFPLPSSAKTSNIVLTICC